MRAISDRFPGKLLLFGEYSILLNSYALAFPVEQFYGQLWVMDHKSPPSDIDYCSNREFVKFYDYLIENELDEFLDLNRMKEDIDNALSFRSNIPNSYGLGSSAALVSAVYDVYKLNDAGNYKILQERLAKMESYYHTKSSGLDPLTSYLRKIVLVRAGEVEIIENLTIDSLPFKISLIDSRTKGETSSLVSNFKIQLANDLEFKTLFEGKYIELNNKIIESILNLDEDFNFDDLSQLIDLQHKLLAPMYTSAMMEQSQQGLRSGEFHLKLCGSGGGGFFILITPKGNPLPATLDQTNITSL